ncbi:MAG: hypothetical protein IPK64_20295 [bacterium]|jgi:uncharacterized membrane protein|nr:hypothetical protein [bacterium]
MSNILRRLNYIEPARVRAVWTAVVMLLASAGVAVSTDVDATVTGAIGLLFALLALVQGETTRAATYSPATVDKVRDEGLDDY